MGMAGWFISDGFCSVRKYGMMLILMMPMALTMVLLGGEPWEFSLSDRWSRVKTTTPNYPQFT
jgi:hypothetical protein